MAREKIKFLIDAKTDEVLTDAIDALDAGKASSVAFFDGLEAQARERAEQDKKLQGTLWATVENRLKELKLIPDTFGTPGCKCHGDEITINDDKQVFFTKGENDGSVVDEIESAMKQFAADLGKKLGKEVKLIEVTQEQAQKFMPKPEPQGEIH